MGSFLKLVMLFNSFGVVHVWLIIHQIEYIGRSSEYTYLSSTAVVAGASVHHILQIQVSAVSCTWTSVEAAVTKT